MKGEIYNFILHSAIGTGSTTASKSFFVDWGILPNSRYKLTFAFTTGTVASINTSYDAILYIPELGCTNNVTCMSQTGSSAYDAGYIGILRNVTTFLEINTIDNPPSFLRSKPTNNIINVNIRQNLATTDTDYTPLPLRYTLVLSFEQLDDDKN